jgi:hypothetical protein
VKPLLRATVSREDRDFRAAFEACAVPPSDFTHEAHVRLAYVYLVESGLELAVQRMRDALLKFIEHNDIPRDKFHESMTRAWVLAVRHFMSRGSSSSFEDFIAHNRELLDSKIMLTHYSAGVLFSSDARASFLEPDLDPIPRYERHREGAEPILPAKDVGRTRAFYESLGFTAGYLDDRYEILRRGNLVVHLESHEDLVPADNHTSCYWRVPDADLLYREFSLLGLPSEGQPCLTAPSDVPWGMREFTLRDPSGNLIRVGHERKDDPSLSSEA